jgi:hypothetical protein
MSHERRWRQAVALVVAFGVGASLLAWPPLVVVVVLAMLTVVAAALLSLGREPPADAEHPPAGGPVLVLLRRGLAVAAILESLVVYATFSLPIALALVTLAGATSPRLWRLVLTPVRREATQQQAPPRESPAPSDGSASSDAEALAGMAVTDLCVLWRATFWELRDAAGTAERLSIVERRQGLLDELARRDGEAISAWLRSGARASGGLERFLSGRPRRRGSDAA